FVGPKQKSPSLRLWLARWLRLRGSSCPDLHPLRAAADRALTCGGMPAARGLSVAAPGPVLARHFGVGQLDGGSAGLEVDIPVHGVERLGCAQRQRRPLLVAPAVDLLGGMARLIWIDARDEIGEQPVELGDRRPGSERAVDPEELAVNDSR